jgi:flagella basal body P-ring formation protein FlgA
MSRKTIMRKFFILPALALLGQGLTAWTTPASAQAFQNLDQLDSLISTTVGANIGEPGGAIGPVDRRMRLAACPQIPSIEGPMFGAAIVRCDKLGWRIRVPLKLAPQNAAAGQEGYGQQGYSRVPQPQVRTILIKKGDPVQLVAGNANFSVMRAMIADEDGAVGDMIRVREDKASAPVSGRVEQDGIVRIPGI